MSRESFDAAYILLLSQLWFDLQQLSASIEANGSCLRRSDAVQVHAQAVFLELALLRRRGSELLERRALTAQQLRRLHDTIDDVRGLLTFEPARLSSHAVRSIGRAQNRLFDEVQEIALQWVEPRQWVGEPPERAPQPSCVTSRRHANPSSGTQLA